MVAEDAVTSLRRMKEEGSAPMRTMESRSLNKTLLRGRMVETLQLVTRKRLSLASQARYLARPAATRICATISERAVHWSRKPDLSEYPVEESGNGRTQTHGSPALAIAATRIVFDSTPGDSQGRIDQDSDRLR